MSRRNTSIASTLLSRRTLLAIMSLSMLIFLSLIVHTIATTHKTAPVVKEKTIYACEQCGKKNVFNNPYHFIPNPEQDNSSRFATAIVKIQPNNYLPTIFTKRLILREATHGDLETLHRYYQKPENAQSSTWEVHTTLAETEKYVTDHVFDRYKKNQAANWAVCLHDGTLIGLGGFVGVTPAHHRGTVGWWIDNAFWGNGYTTELAHAVLEYGFKRLDLNRIDACVRIDNIASQKVLQKAGMNLTAISRDYWRIKAELMTFYQFAILKKNVLSQLEKSIL